jgi:hypothetical protein
MNNRQPPPDLCKRTKKRHAMQAIMRKYSTGLMTLVVYAVLIAFALLCNWDIL